jgi:hypothetical protein
MPACLLLYGWGVEKNVGGLPLAVIVLFLQGVAQLFCFPSLNAYCLDVMGTRGAEVMAANYVVRYVFACIATAVVLPATETIGVGWFSTLTAVLLLVCAASLVATVRWGKKWRDAVDRKKGEKKEAKFSGAVTEMEEGGDGVVREEQAHSPASVAHTLREGDDEGDKRSSVCVRDGDDRGEKDTVARKNENDGAVPAKAPQEKSQ